MKKSIANFLKFGTFLLGISFLLWNCEKNTEVIPEIEASNYIIRHKTYDFISGNKELVNKINSFSKVQGKQVLSLKGRAIKTADFTIFTDKVTYIKQLGNTKESYSFCIESNKGKGLNKIENLILSKDLSTNEYKSYIITYLFPNGINSKEEHFEIVNFKEIDISRISEGNFNTLKSRNCGYEYSVSETKHDCYSGDHSGAGEAGNCSGKGSLPYSTWAISSQFTCDSGGGGGGSSTVGSGPGNPTGGGNTGNGNGGSDGVETGIVLPPSCQSGNCEEEILANQINKLLNKNLSYEELIWLNNNDIQANLIKTFLNSNNNSAKAKNWGKGQIELETLIQDSKRNWKPNIGIIKNNPNLKYTHSDSDGKISYFKMTDGSIIVSSGIEKKLSAAGDLINKYRDGGGDGFGEFLYIKLPNQPFAELLLTPENTGDDLKGLFAMAGKDLGVNLGRYVLPIEDIKILIDGKDFDGQDVARWKAAGGILLTVVPGGKAIGTGVKLFKPVLIIAGNIKNWNKVIRWGNSSYKLTYKVVFNTITFGDRSQLARVLKTTGDVEAHHIIPWAKCKNAVIQAAAKVGFHPNMVQNGLGLKKYTKLIGEGLHGNHPAYDDFVIHRLNTFMKNGFSPESANIFLVNNLIPELKTLITKANNTNLNLNQYFKTVVNHSNGIPNY